MLIHIFLPPMVPPTPIKVLYLRHINYATTLLKQAFTTGGGRISFGARQYDVIVQVVQVFIIIVIVIFFIIVVMRGNG